MYNLSEKEILNNALKMALEQERYMQAKYAYLARTVRDKTLQEMFASYAVACRRHIAQLKTEMKNANIR